MIATIETQNSHSTDASLFAADESEHASTSSVQIDAPAAASVSDSNAKAFQRLHEIVKKGASAFIEVGQALNAIHEDMLWKAGGYKTWGSYCKSVVGLSKSHAHRLMDASEVALHLGKPSPRGDAGSEVIAPTSEFQIRPLLRVKDPEQRTEAWIAACENSADGQPTAAEVKKAVAKLLSPAETPASEPVKLKASAYASQEVALPSTKATKLVTQLREVVDQGESWEAVKEILAEMEELLSGANVAA